MTNNYQVKQNLINLVNFIDEKKFADFDSPWTLSKENVLELNKKYPLPFGSWTNFAALAAGTPFVKAVLNGFIVEQKNVNDYSEIDLHEIMMGAWLDKLVPPRMFASMAIACNISPRYGLKIAKIVQENSQTEPELDSLYSMVKQLSRESVSLTRSALSDSPKSLNELTNIVQALAQNIFKDMPSTCKLMPDNYKIQDNLVSVYVQDMFDYLLIPLGVAKIDNKLYKLQ
jgi:hypothetical protein